MNRPPESVAASHGAWGEGVAAELLRRRGWVIVDRNVHPSRHRPGVELDIVAYDPEADSMVFVEVKQHASHSPGESRIRSVNREKRANLRLACNAWRRGNGWRGNYRFDVVEVYGVPGSRPEVDHIRNVNLFVNGERFVKWGEQS